MIPPFDERGFLPPGEYVCAWTECVERFGNHPQRQRLLTGLREVLDILRAAGCRTVYLDGSFVTDKPRPNDVDAAYSTTGLDWEQLQRAAPELLDFRDGRAAQKRRYGGEFFPAEWAADLAGEPFLSFFQHDRDGRPKGVVVLHLEAAL